jgi:acyl carrier protein
MTKKDIKGILKKYVVEEMDSDSNHLNDETLLFEEGIFDSIGLVFLLEFIKKEFHITIKNDDIHAKNFKSINSIADFIQSNQ